MRERLRRMRFAKTKVKTVAATCHHEKTGEEEETAVWGLRPSYTSKGMNRIDAARLRIWR